MKFLAWCPIAIEILPGAIGRAEYSYAFVMKALLPVLGRVGAVEVIDGPAAKLAQVAADMSAAGEMFRVMCFCPPNLVPPLKDIPTTAVVAWEFDAIPTSAWSNNPANDWRTALSDHGQVITLSSYSADAIRKCMGPSYPVTALPVPMPVIQDATDRRYAARPAAIEITGEVLEFRDFEKFHDDITELRRPSVPEWDGRPAELKFGLEARNSAALVGFYDQEDWGTWSATSRPVILLPFALRGYVSIELEALAYGGNVGREVRIELGKTIHQISLAGSATYRIEACLWEPVSIITVRGIDTTAVAGAEDLRSMGIGLISIRVRRTAPAGDLDTIIASHRPPPWGGQSTHLEFNSSAERSADLIGFYDREEWGVWSAATRPVILLPFALEGTVTFRLVALSYGNNVGRAVEISAGDARHSIVLTGDCVAYEFTLQLKQPATFISISELDTRPVPGAQDPRPMGMGLVSLDVTPLHDPVTEQAQGWVKQQARTEGVETSTFVPAGVVFTSVLNPADGRKNLADIVTAFCYALGRRSDATLVLKLTHYSMDACLGQIYQLLRRVGSINARIVVAQGYLEDENYRRLIDATTWYVNASHGEGLCIPLMEFMSSGVPAIAPTHTAMRDYVTERSALVVASSPMPTCWPNDPSARLRTLHYRINWQSLVDCYHSAYDIAVNDQARYLQLSRSAIEDLKVFSSAARIEGLLRSHFGGSPQ